MITREEAKEVIISGVMSMMEKQGKTLSDYCLMSPKKGKCAWTYGEYIEAVREDKALEDSNNNNPLDTYMNYLAYKENHKQ